MKRRLFAIAMTLAMALSLLPVTALADGPEDQTPPSVTVTDGCVWSASPASAVTGSRDRAMAKVMAMANNRLFM